MFMYCKIQKSCTVPIALSVWQIINYFFISLFMLYYYRKGG
nr:MAG TPA: hypothetical protein [Caudoviricetes sp.]DAU24032.1 MAG TPA: hypothetical protein [Caudoviricetes sp.]